MHRQPTPRYNIKNVFGVGTTGCRLQPFGKDSSRSIIKSETPGHYLRDNVHQLTRQLRVSVGIRYTFVYPYR